MSHRLPRVLAPVNSLDSAQRAVAYGADILDAGQDADLAVALSGARLAVSPGGARLEVLVCGSAEDADLTWDPAIAVRTGAVLVCDGVLAAESSPVPAARLVVKIDAQSAAAAATPAAAAAAATPAAAAMGSPDWTTMVDVDERWATSVNAAMAVSALCVWQGVSVIRTRHVLQVRRCVDMTASVMGIRPPARAIRGLG